MGIVLARNRKSALNKVRKENGYTSSTMFGLHDNQENTTRGMKRWTFAKKFRK